MKKVNLTQTQREKLNSLWFIYGNRGPKSSLNNHRFIQTLLEQEEDCRNFYFPSQECLDEVDNIYASRI